MNIYTYIYQNMLFTERIFKNSQSNFVVYVDYMVKGLEGVDEMILLPSVHLCVYPFMPGDILANCLLDLSYIWE